MGRGEGNTRRLGFRISYWRSINISNRWFVVIWWTWWLLTNPFFPSPPSVLLLVIRCSLGIGWAPQKLPWPWFPLKKKGGGGRKDFTLCCLAPRDGWCLKCLIQLYHFPPSSRGPGLIATTYSPHSFFSAFCLVISAFHLLIGTN